MAKSGRLTYIGHATVLVEQAGVRLLTDPLLHSGIGHMRRRVPLPELELLRDLDAVLISHPHADHLDVKSLRMLEHPGTVVAPRECAGLLRRAGMRDVVGLTPGERCDVGAVTIEAVRADHDGRRHPFGRELGAVGFIVEGPARVYFAGDTDLFDEMSEVSDSLDVALLPVAGWGRRLPPGHLDPRRAAEALRLLRPRVAVPIHWGTYRQFGLSKKPDVLRGPPEAFEQLAHELAPEVDVRLLPVGGSLDLASVGVGQR